MLTIATTVLFLMLIYVGLATVYMVGLAIAYFMVPDRPVKVPEPLKRIAILVPAHNEELLIPGLCESLLAIDYPKEKFDIFIIADNCSDGTVEACRRFPLTVLERHDPARKGKGQALSWALGKIPVRDFDAVFIVDADNIVDPRVLTELSVHLNRGEDAIQCYNAVRNRDDSWFTQLLYVSRTMVNELYHHAKYKLGLSSYLMGNGLCFSSGLLGRKGWTAFSTGEDWEYYAQLIEDGLKVGFATGAKVFHQESRSLSQATSQRLRWSSGRFRIAKTFGLRLLRNGLRQKNGLMMDASLPLVFPNYSLLINLTLVGLVVSVALPVSAARTALLFSFPGLLAAQLSLFLAASFLAGAMLKTLRAAVYAPAFLVWKSVIDLLCFTGLYNKKEWVRTKRHI